MKAEELEQGKIYCIIFGGVILLGRFKEMSTTQIIFFDHLHYWCGFEKFHINGYCLKSGIDEIRRATVPEKQSLVRFEIDHECI